MKLEFENGLVPKDLMQELGFDDYLASFTESIPLIPDQILKPLQKNQAKDIYDRQRNLESHLDKHVIDIQSILQHCKNIPAINHILPIFENQELESFHLFDLGRFVQNSMVLEQIEETFPLKQRNNTVCIKILKLLNQYLIDDFGTLKLSSQAAEQQKELKNLNNQINRALKNIESKITQHTGLKIVFPLSKDIEKEECDLSSIKNSGLLHVEEKGDFVRLTILLNEDAKGLIKKRDNLQKTIQRSFKKILSEINAELQPYFLAFKEYVTLRQQRVLDYLIIYKKQFLNLCFPKIDNGDLRIEFKKANLPSLKEQLAELYKPLNAEFSQGVNVLYGANMTGKTTVLKTLYFNLVLAKFGLPLPADEAMLSYPENISLLLRNSGELKTGLSGFGKELQFFCDMDESASVYLVDELFHSTDPVNGAKLSRAVLSSLIESPMIFFCTSHYPEVLNIPGIRLYKMKDMESEIASTNIKDLLANFPFEVEFVPTNQISTNILHSQKPLQLALQFPLSKKILKNLRKQLDN